MAENLINIEQLRPKAHPFRKVFRRHGVSNAMIANYLGLGYSYVNNLINGVFRMPAHHEAKLQALVDQLEGGSNKNDRTNN